jgi:hypothetical protein|nr:MAG TPA: cell division protein [Caudoviricetes sp.]
MILTIINIAMLCVACTLSFLSAKTLRETSYVNRRIAELERLKKALEAKGE